MIQFKQTHELLGAHVHVAIWVRRLPTETWALSGRLVMTSEEHAAWTAMAPDIQAATSDDRAMSTEDYAARLWPDGPEAFAADHPWPEVVDHG